MASTPDVPQGNDQENVNLRAAYIHVLGDIIQSIGVIIVALIITYAPGWDWIDPICTFLFSVIVFFTTTPVTRDCLRILMESTPKGTDPDVLRTNLKLIEGVVSVHDLHIWSISVSKVCMSAHVVTN